MHDGRIRVLLVDDHAIVRTGVKLMLSSEADMSIEGEAGTVEEALQLVRNEEFDVALVDIAMPGKNGLDLLKRLRAEKPRLAVLMLSTYAEDIYAVRALKMGASGYIAKDSSPAALIAAVRKASAGGKYVSPALVEKLAIMVSEDVVTSHEALSNRELEVLKLIAAGESLNHIAGKLHLSPHTVTTYRSRILTKMGLSNNAELTRFAIENGLIT
jgi:DNA-binding NarL/FixJ family response regulator